MGVDVMMGCPRGKSDRVSGCGGLLTAVGLCLRRPHGLAEVGRKVGHYTVHMAPKGHKGPLPGKS